MKHSKVEAYITGDFDDDAGLLPRRDQEMKDFIGLPLHSMDPLAWWHQLEKHFGSLALLNKKYLAVPATSIPSKCTFSTAGLTVSKLQSN